MEADAEFVRRRQRRRLVTAEAPGAAAAAAAATSGSSDRDPPPRVAGGGASSAGAEVRWLLGGGGGGGGRLWGGVSERGSMLPPRRLGGAGGGGGELLQKVHFSCVAVPNLRRGEEGDPLLHRDCCGGGGGGGGGGGDDEPDYEGLPVGASTSTHMLAGAVAGVMEHCLMFPIDCVKTRMQSLQPAPAARYRNVMDALRRIVTTEGVWRPIRGLNATAVGAGPAHALYFACYEKLKKTLSDAIHPGANSHLANGTAGCVATLLHDAAMNPSEVVKQRMQMYNSPYRGVVECVRAVWAAEGAAAFYRSYTTQLTMNVPFQALHFMTYEYLQELLNPRRQYNPSSHMASGALAGAIAAAATTPLDVCKTLLNTQESLAPRPGQGTGGAGGHNNNNNGRISGLAHAFRTVYRLGGLRGFLKGVQARVIYQMPSTAISWSVYEFFKYGITEHQHQKRRAQQQHRGAEM